MPVIVIGADTPTGAAILAVLRNRAGEVRAFVSDELESETLRATEVKVATGDLSDVSHIEGACTNCFCAVLVTEAAYDGRALAFARSPREAVAGWQAAVRSSGVTRAIWVESPGAELGDVSASAPEVAEVNTLGRPLDDIVAEVAALDDAAEI